MLAERLSRVRERIHQACKRCGRDPQAVQLVCVTKTVPLEVIRQAVALGVTDIGENRVQEAHSKVGRVKAEGGSAFTSDFRLPTSDFERIRWHLIGHLQRNKAKDAVALFDVIHSVDSLALAEELERHTAKRAQGSRLKARGENLQPSAYSLQPIEVFVQVNVSGEATKSGCKPDEVNQLAQAVQRSPRLQLRGLMTIPPFSDDPEDARPHFRRLRDLRDELQQRLATQALRHSPPAPGARAAGQAGTQALLLSMGMSHDFEVAIEEGADYVRIGTAIFATSDKGQATS